MTESTEDPGPNPERGLVGEFRDAVTVRAVVLVGGVAVLQLGFLASYVGAFHRPVPPRLPMAIAAYALVTGLLGALIVGPWLHALPSHVIGLWLLGALLVFCAGAFSMGLQVVAGTIGIGLSILLFVVLGNPSAGGAYAWPLLPSFWRVIGPWIPSGAGTSAARGIAYFGSTGIGTDLLVIGLYGLVGLTLVYGVLLRVGHQVVHLPEAARRREVEAQR